MPDNPAVPEHLPFFITPPGDTDSLMVIMLVFLLVVVLAIGNLYFRLHALPEQMAHRTNHIQMQVVAVLALLALFTHNQIFWIGALLLALVQFPDFSSPINSIARSLRTMASGAKRPPAAPAERATEGEILIAETAPTAPVAAASPVKVATAAPVSQAETPAKKA